MLIVLSTLPRAFDDAPAAPALPRCRNKFTKRCYLYDDFSKDQLTYAYGVYAGYIKCT
jgi:hypothetical protein